MLRAPEGYAGAQTVDALSAAGAVVLKWGSFLTVVINFLLLALVVFFMVKAVNAARDRVSRQEALAPEAPAAPAAPPEDVALLREIRDSLKR